MVDAIKFTAADDTSMWRRRVWYIAAVVSVVSTAGLVLIMRFLVPLTLDDADKWASVGAMLLAYVALVGGALVWLIRWTGLRLDAGNVHTPDLPGRKGPNQPRPEVMEADRNVLRRSLPVPRQLPPDVSHFIGRQGDLTRLDGLLDTPRDRNTTMVISAVAGTAGVGKTALAVHWAHHAQERFPDGTLYANLRGYDSGPAAPATQVLDGFLRALNIAPERIPSSLEAQVGLFRSLLHGRRMCIVLDNAASAEQVRPLLPNSPGSVVIVTSRSNLSGLVARDGARRITIDMLTESEATALLGKVIGKLRVDAEPAAVSELARRCAYLPLALRIAAERVAARPNASLAETVNELGGERERLDTLASADDDETAAIREVFSWSYRALPAESARAFRLLGLQRGPDIGMDAAAALLGIAAIRARRVLDLLVDAHLLEEYQAGRYRFHDLLREYAAECGVHDETEEDRTDAIHRMLAWYLNAARAAGHILDRQRLTRSRQEVPAEFAEVFTTHAAALLWYQRELDNLVAATQQAFQLDDNNITIELPRTIRSFLQLSMNFEVWTTVAGIGLAAARRTGNRLGEAHLLGVLAAAAHYRGRSQETLDYIERAVAIYRELGRLDAMALVNLGFGYGGVGRHAEAMHFFSQAVDLARETGDLSAEGQALDGLAGEHIALGRTDAAIDHALLALTVFRRGELSYGEGIALLRLAGAYLALGRSQDAIPHGERAAAINIELGNRLGEAWALESVATALDACGQSREATERWHRALTIYREIGLDEDAKRIDSVLDSPRGDTTGPEPRLTG